MDVQKNPWKKGTLRPLSSNKQKDEQQSKKNTNKDMNNGLIGIEITGTKIAKQSEIGLMKFSMNNGNKSQRSNRTDQENEIEEEKWNSGNKKISSQSKLMDDTMYSEESNLYIDDQVDKNRGNFGNFMRDKIDNNPDTKHEKRREHDEELKKQTSKPFQMQKGRMSSSASNTSKQRSAFTTNEGLDGLHYDKSTQYGSKHETKSEIGDDLLAPSEDILGSRVQQMSVMGNYQNSQETHNRQQVQNKPFKISDLKRNGSKIDQTQQQQESNKTQQQEKSQSLSSTLKKPRQNLSMKEKRKIEEEEAILKKNSKNQQNQTWKVNDPLARQLEQQVKQNKDKKREQIEKIEKSLSQIEKKMTKRNKLKVIALVHGNDNMEDINTNQPMTEFDIELAEKEAKVYEMERKQRMSRLQEFLEDSVDDLSKMSSSEIRNRALFITEFAKNKSSMQSSFYSQMSKQSDIKQQEDESKEQNEFDDMEEEMSIQEEKKDNNRNFIKKNIINAFKTETQQVNTDIEEFMSSVARERLQELLEGCEEFDVKAEEQKLLSQGNPFGLTTEQSEELKHLQEQLESIKMSDDTIQQILGHELFSLKDAILPKEQHLRDKREIQILREKMNQVNERLSKLFEVEKIKDAKSKIGNKVEKIKIQNLVAELIQQGIPNEPSIELQNLIDDFQENGRLLTESRKILSDLQGQDIEKELGEYNAILLEAIQIQKQYEQILDLPQQNALMEEQCEIIDGFKKKFEEIQQIQSEIEEKDKKFIQFVKDNNVADLFGMQFNEANDDYEIEDLKQVEKDEQEKLQAQIQAELDRINKRYENFKESEIDQKLNDMEEYDAMIRQKLSECNPNLLDDLRESIIQQQEEEDLKRSQLLRYQLYPATEENQQQNSEEEKQEINNEINIEENRLKLENNIQQLEQYHGEEIKQQLKQQKFLETLKVAREHEQNLEKLLNKKNDVSDQVNNNQSTETSLSNGKRLQDSSLQEEQSSMHKSSAKYYSTETNSQEDKKIEFEDSLEM